MANITPITIQTNAHKASINSIENYSLMLGGLNVTHAALEQYDPLITGYTRIFMVRKPIIFTKILQDEFNRFKHILEYGNTAIDGNGDVELGNTTVSGGYVGREFDIPTVTKDSSNGLSIKTFEFSGSPMREILHFWCNAISDNQSGFATYGGLIQAGQLSYKQANHTAEFIVVSTDRTGMKVENACMWCNCFPKGYKNDQFNYSAGDHEKVELSVDFYGTKYESAEINKKAEILLAFVPETKNIRFLLTHLSLTLVLVILSKKTVISNQVIMLRQENLYMISTELKIRFSIVLQILLRLISMITVHLILQHHHTQIKVLKTVDLINIKNTVEKFSTVFLKFW